MEPSGPRNASPGPSIVMAVVAITSLRRQEAADGIGSCEQSGRESGGLRCEGDCPLQYEAGVKRASACGQGAAKARTGA
eukprot:scaffold2630_cov118-Isochrysis_galbana.AAC.6